MKRLTIAFLLCGLLFRNAAAGIRFSGRIEFAEHGLTIPALDGAQPYPAKMPEVKSRIEIAADGPVRLDYHRPEELWWLRMLCGQWADREGNLFTVAALSHLPPEKNLPLYTYRDFMDVLLVDQNRINPDSRDEAVAAAEVFGGFKGGERETISVNRFHLSDSFHLKTDNPKQFVYLVRPAQKNDAARPDWFLIRVEQAGSEPAEFVRRNIERQLIDFIEKTGKPNPVEESDDGVRALAEKSIRFYPQWRRTDGDNFVLITDADEQIGRALIAEIRRAKPILDSVFRKRIPPPGEFPQTDFIRLIGSSEQFVRFVGQDLSWAAGVYVPSRRELVLKTAVSQEETLKVFRHETFHQYLAGVYGDLPFAPWFNEGHAVLFETAQISARDIAYPVNQAYEDLVFDNLERIKEYLPGFLSASYQSFYSVNRELNYALACTLVRYLQFAAKDESRKPYGDAIEKYTASLLETGDPVQAIRAAFGDTGKFTEHFIARIRENRRRKQSVSEAVPQ